MALQRRIGFVANHLSLRGCEVCLFDYADYNERILRNISYIFTRPFKSIQHIYPTEVHPDAYQKFVARFGDDRVICMDELEKTIPDSVKKLNIDVLFIEKAGTDKDGLDFSCCPTIIHAVFTTKYPHGTVYCPISPFLNTRFNTYYPVLPYIVQLHPTLQDMRQELGISPSAMVYGSYGGAEQFDTFYVKRAIHTIIQTNIAIEKDIHFIFMNHLPFGPKHPRIHFLPGSADMERKRQFINTTNAMIYGRKEGETFGLAIAEFALAKKPIIASRIANARFHLDSLGDRAITHQTAEELIAIITNWTDVLDRNPSATSPHIPYLVYSPENVMSKFNEILTKL